MEKGKSVPNAGINLVLRQLFNSRKLSIKDFSKVLNRSEVITHRYLNNPYLMTLKQLLLLAGYCGIPFIELMALIHYNKGKRDKDVSKTLEDLSRKYGSE